MFLRSRISAPTSRRCSATSPARRCARAGSPHVNAIFKSPCSSSSHARVLIFSSTSSSGLRFSSTRRVESRGGNKGGDTEVPLQVWRQIVEGRPPCRLDRNFELSPPIRLCSRREQRDLQPGSAPASGRPRGRDAANRRARRGRPGRDGRAATKRRCSPPIPRRRRNESRLRLHPSSCTTFPTPDRLLVTASSPRRSARRRRIEPLGSTRPSFLPHLSAGHDTRTIAASRCSPPSGLVPSLSRSAPP